jgi:MFS family permease
MEQSATQGITVFSNRNFVALWAGQGLSVLGDQFAMIGMPWLVLQITRDPAALGTVLALQGIPRALFMVVGGAVTDRVSARSVMLAADCLRLAMFVLLAGLTASGLVQIWMLYFFALAFGLVSGFFNPASSAIVPRLVESSQLRTANSVIQATAMLSSFLGPGIAGALIAWLAGQSLLPSVQQSTGGIALAFAVDAASFLVSALTLFLIQDPRLEIDLDDLTQNMLSAIRDGIVYVWQTPFLRTAYLILMALNLFCVGPLEIGIPVLANTVLKEGVMAYGLIMTGYGGGNLGGILLAGALPKPAPRRLKNITVLLILLFGTGLIGLSTLASTPAAFLIALAMGLGNGYMALSYITIIQQRSPRALLGRIMSLLMLANLGLVPISQAVTGTLIRFGLPPVFIGAGVLILGVGAWAQARPELLVQPDNGLSDIHS